MFGTFRYVLAMLVVYGHYFPLKAQTFNWAGQYAVFSFYALSGYLMTLVLQRRYGFSPRGLARYLINRGLRIYPPYLVTAAMAVTIIAIYPDVADGFGHRLRLPIDAVGWVVNVVIVGIHTPQYARVVPPSWSLSVELIYYVAMGLLLARSRVTILVWLAGSLLFTSYTIVADWPFAYRIATPSAASIAFSVGAAIYLLPAPRGWPWLLPAAVAGYLGNTLAAHLLWPSVETYGLYTSLALAATLIWCLRAVDAEAAPPILRRIDAKLGDLSYPIFLCHYPLGALVIALAFDGERPDFALLFWCAIPVIHVVALLIHAMVERPAERLRDRVREW